MPSGAVYTMWWGYGTWQGMGPAGDRGGPI